MSDKRPWEKHNFSEADNDWFEQADSELTTQNVPTKVLLKYLHDAIEVRLVHDASMLELFGDPTEWVTERLMEASEQGQRVFTRPMRSHFLGLVEVWCWCVIAICGSAFFFGLVNGQATSMTGVPQLLLVLACPAVSVALVWGAFHAKLVLRRGYPALRFITAFVGVVIALLGVPVALNKVDELHALPHVVALPQWSVGVLGALAIFVVKRLPDSENVAWPSVAHEAPQKQDRKWQYLARVFLVHRCNYSAVAAHQTVAELTAEAHEYGSSLLDVHGEPAQALASVVPEPEPEDDETPPYHPKSVLFFAALPVLQVGEYLYNWPLTPWQGVYVAVVVVCLAAAGALWWVQERKHGAPVGAQKAVYWFSGGIFWWGLWLQAETTKGKVFLAVIAILCAAAWLFSWAKGRFFAKEKSTAESSTAVSDEGGPTREDHASWDGNFNNKLFDHQHVRGLLREAAGDVVLVSFSAAALWACAVPWSLKSLTGPVDVRVLFVCAIAVAILRAQSVLINRVNMFFPTARRQWVTAALRLVAMALLASSWWGASWVVRGDTWVGQLPTWLFLVLSVGLVVVWFVVPDAKPEPVWSDDTVDDRTWARQFRELLFYQHRQCPTVIDQALDRARQEAGSGPLAATFGAPKDYIARTRWVPHVDKVRAWAEALWPVAAGCLALWFAFGRQNWGWPAAFALLFCLGCAVVVYIAVSLSDEAKDAA